MEDTIQNKEKTKQLRKIQEAPAFKRHPTYDESYALGKSLREKCPRTSHGFWKAPSRRPDLLSLILQSEEGRLKELMPLRHGRMAQSPFTFYRAGALIMANDLATTTNSGIRVQCCGDAHLSNFGGFASPERQVIFSINDLDESLPAPWEWDIKRLAASFVIGCRNNGLSDAVARDVARTCVESYRKHIARFSEMKQLDLWYYMIESTSLIGSIRDPAIRKRAVKRIEKARETSTIQDVFPKLAHSEGERHLIKEQLPTIFHMKGTKPGEIHDRVKEAFAGYRETLTPAHRLLLDRYELKDVAIKVVGVGSVGTLCWVALMMADNKDALFLQIKQAGPSVLEPFAGKSIYGNSGQRVVNGYRMMQPASDIFLGWTTSRRGNHYYFRQLRDMKIKILVETFGKAEMMIFADWCSHALALSHARSGNAAMLRGYMGKSDILDKAIEDFAIAYADLNEKDFNVFKRAIKSGKIKAVYDKVD